MGGLPSGRRMQECLRLGEAAAGLRGVGGGEAVRTGPLSRTCLPAPLSPLTSAGKVLTVRT